MNSDRRIHNDVPPAVTNAGEERPGFATRKGRQPQLLTMGLVPALCVIGMAAGTAGAQEPAAPAGEIEEVIVTAELRSTPWLAQTASTSVMGERLIRERNAVHLEDLLLVAPNINLSGGSSRARFYQVRGIGERSQFVEPLNPSVGLLIDNIDFSGLGTGASLFDVEQVEILRGPQGTLHGANALAGLINMRSAAPEERFGARLYSAVGDYGRREAGASITGPLLGDQLLYRLAVFTHRSDGFMDNAHLGRDDTNNRDESLYRARLRWQPDDAQQLDVTLVRSDTDNGYDAFSLDNTRTTLSDNPGKDVQRSDAMGLHYRVRRSDVLIEVLGSAADSDMEYSYDEDWSFVGIAPDLEYSSFDRYLRDRRSYSAQLRVASAEPLALGIGDLDWVAGLYGLSDDESLRRQYTFLSEDFTSRFQADTVAAFGQVDLAISDTWKLTAGLRIAERSMNYQDNQDVRGEPEDSLWGGKVALSYDSAGWGMFYGAVSRGYRAGGVNAGILAFPDQASTPDLQGLEFFDTEVLYNVELGHKMASSDGRLRSALTLFYMDRNDQQVRGSLVIPRDNGSTAFIDFTDNAATGANYGLEWELQSILGEKLQGYLNLGLLRARFDEYINADGVDLADREQANAPSYQFAAGLTYRPLEHVKADLQLEGRDAFYFSDRHDEQSDSYALLHFRLAYEASGWELALWGRNLLDEDYFIRGFGSFGNDPRKFYVTEEYVQFGEPRQLGLSLEFRL